ncbi:Uncharacterized protein TCM_028992 [Theobroma cacao]|uniref:Uncharacterized protein n=1 Tax=Theobroma cacao TaxID=3641 RepID=A0A061GBU5_THECC|nr:Uncharacterized protein TCM_028992 [Theobroma cacao]
MTCSRASLVFSIELFELGANIVLRKRKRCKQVMDVLELAKRKITVFLEVLSVMASGKEQEENSLVKRQRSTFPSVDFLVESCVGKQRSPLPSI